MSIETPKIRKVTPRPRKRSSSAAFELPLEGNSFQATLNECGQTEPLQESGTQTVSTTRQTERLPWHAIGSEMLRRGWSFLYAKYKITTTKRLRVAETISLGEKRFVAIVTVEGKEFLIGGGVAGMSLLAQLGPGAGATRRVKQKIGESEVAL